MRQTKIIPTATTTNKSLRGLLVSNIFILSFITMLKSNVVEAQIIPLIQECSDDMYFNTAIYSCLDCGENAVQNKTDGKSSLN